MTVAHIPLTLIVATTPSLGIGRAGSLPWPPLRNEMAYFARVTRRVPLGKRKVNAVIMGRKTWDSIPMKFRPLKGRLNVVVSRNLHLGTGSDGEPESALVKRIKWSQDEEGKEDGTGVVSFKSLDAAVEGLQEWSVTSHDSEQWGLHRVFIIGGSQTYENTIKKQGATRVLRTKVLQEFDCDAHFPLRLEESTEWRKARKDELDAWTGETVPEGILSEKDVEWEFEMWEREAGE